jgi:hypothetical protein
MNTNASGSDGEDPMAEPRAYNHSIYLMVSMPYLLLGSFGLMCYWKVRMARRTPTRPTAPQSGADQGGIHGHN